MPAIDPPRAAEWNYPTSIAFGPGVIRSLPDLLRAAGVTKALVITDGGLVKHPPFKFVTEALADLPHDVYSGVQPNPLAEQADAAASAYRAGRCDGIVALGGGSAIDVAKVARIVVSHGGAALDYDWTQGGIEKITADQPFLVAVPTTAGTGSEVGRSSVVTDPETHTKRTVFSRFMMPPQVLCDPELTISLPPSVTAHTGIDALTHAIEAYLTPAGYHPQADGIALHAIGMIAAALPRAVAQGDDLAARGTMMSAALMGATAFQKGLGATHALAHPLSTLCGLPHGLANGLLLPFLLRFNAEAVPERVADVGQALAQTDDAASAVADLTQAVGFPADLRAAGVDPNMLEPLVQQALGEFLLSENPRPVSEDQIRALYLEAFGD